MSHTHIDLDVVKAEIASRFPVRHGHQASRPDSSLEVIRRVLARESRPDAPHGPRL